MQVAALDYRTYPTSSAIFQKIQKDLNHKKGFINKEKYILLIIFSLNSHFDLTDYTIV